MACHYYWNLLTHPKNSLLPQVKELEEALHAAQAEGAAHMAKAAESEAALRACMGRIADLEARVGTAPEAVSPKVCIYLSGRVSIVYGGAHATFPGRW